jgi:hypothetical protein
VLLKVWFKNWSSNNKLRETYFQKRGGNRFSHLDNAEAEVRSLVAEYPDATLIELSELLGVADLRYERLNMQVIETTIHKASGFLTNFFHTLIKQRQLLLQRTGIG